MGLTMGKKHADDPGLKNFTLIEKNIDVAPLLSELEEKKYLWDQITKRQDTEGSPHKYTKAIFLRWCKDQSIAAAFTDLNTENYPAFDELKSAHPLIEKTVELAGITELARVLIVDLEPKGQIALHSDEGLYADTFERFHLCLSSDEGNQFTSMLSEDAGEFLHMKPGELWNFHHKAPHTLYNFSETSRIHLIIDGKSPMYRRERT